MSDADLVRRCRGDDVDAWRELIRRYSPLVYRVAHRVVRTQQDAEDVSQETFMAAHRSLNTFDATRPFAPWIARIAYNNSLKRMRGHVAQRTVSLDAQSLPDSAVSADELCAPSANPESDAIRSEEKALVVTALERLAAQDRVLLDLRYREGLSNAEVSEATGIPVNTVKTRVFRARGCLKTILAPLIKPVER